MSTTSTHIPRPAETDAAAFDALAESYDATFTDTRLGGLLRERVWHTLVDVLPAEAVVLELGCGTGEDAARLSSRGHRVLATDASEAMLDRARRRVAERGDPARVRFAQLDLETLADGRAREVLAEAGALASTPPFDAVLANFGVLNCTDRWSDLAEALSPLLRPGAVAALTVMGPWCPWEWAWYLVRGHPRTAFRRLSGRSRAKLGSGPELDIRYPSADRLCAAFAPTFRPLHREGIGTALPPTYAGGTLEGMNGLLDVLARWDHRLGRTGLGARLCDHYLLVMERSSADIIRGASPHPPFDRDLERREGIWRALPDERAEEVAPFLEQYRTVRSAEGRGSDDPEFYRRLPRVEEEHPRAEDWTVRAQSFRTLVSKVVQPLEARSDRPLEILDLGAGNGWLCNRLAERGHRPVAVDLRTDARDGLGAVRHYETDFPAVRADFRALPFAARSFDLVVFDASLHYAPAYETVLQEALRTLRRDGRAAVVDSPVYRDPESGRQMVREREEAYEEEFGFRSDALESEQFLTWNRLDELAASSGCTYAVHRPRRSLRRTLAPLTARLKGDREPARLPVIEIQKESSNLDERSHTTSSAIEKGRNLLAAVLRLIRGPREIRNELSPETGYSRLAYAYNDVENPVTDYSVRMMEQLLPPLENRSVLDVGCGTGRVARMTRKMGSGITVGVDVSREMIERAYRSGGRLLPKTASFNSESVNLSESDTYPIWVQGEATRLPLPDDAFDVVASSLMMGHVRDLRSTVEEMDRVLKPEGILVIVTFHPEATLRGFTRTFSHPESGETFAIEQHIHRIDEYVESLEKVGLTINTFHEEQYEETPIVLGLRAERKPH